MCPILLTTYTPEQIMAFAALVSIAISGGVGFVALRTLRQLRNSTALSERTVAQLQESTELSKNFFQLSNRPYLGIVEQKKISNPRTYDFELEIYVVNHGKLPAIIENISINVKDRDSGEDTVGEFDERKSVVFPDQLQKFCYLISPRDSNGHDDILVRCNISYRDTNENGYGYEKICEVDVRNRAFDPPDVIKFKGESFF